jgi:hypothetical protein
LDEEENVERPQGEVLRDKMPEETLVSDQNFEILLKRFLSFEDMEKTEQRVIMLSHRHLLLT